MSDSKSHQFRPPLYHNQSASTSSGHREPPGRRVRSASEALSEQQGWDAYRKWLSSVSGKPTTERAAVDRSIYSWKGYHNWADRVRQAWEPEEG
jgi:hypothetical protein